MRRGTRRSLVGLVVVIAAVLATTSCQSQREPSVGVVPSHTTVSTSTEPTPTSAAVAIEPSPSSTALPVSPAFPQGEPAQVIVVAVDGTKLIDTSLVPIIRNAAEELVPPFGKAGWYAEADWSQRKPGFPGPSIVVGHISHQSKPDVFYNLTRVRPGDVVTIRYTSGNLVSFQVTRSEAVKKSVATDIKTEVAKSIWQPSGNQSVIRLFTCNPVPGEFVNSHYLGNWVVWGDKRLK